MLGLLSSATKNLHLYSFLSNVTLFFTDQIVRGHVTIFFFGKKKTHPVRRGAMRGAMGLVPLHQNAKLCYY